VSGFRIVSRGVAFPRPTRDEKTEQANIQNLVAQLGGQVYTLGTRRARVCATCGAPADMSTRQTAGLGDLVAFLPPPPRLREARGQRAAWVSVWIEVKGQHGALSFEQAIFRQCCLAARVPHVVGGLDAFLEFARAGGWVK
jgi:hypothetical protein